MPTAVGERTAGGGQDPVACDEPGRPVLRRSTRSCCPRTRISRSLVPSSARGGPADGSAGRRSTQRSKSIDGLRNACSRREPEFPRPTPSPPDARSAVCASGLLRGGGTNLRRDRDPPHPSVDSSSSKSRSTVTITCIVSALSHDCQDSDESAVPAVVVPAVMIGSGVRWVGVAGRAGGSAPQAHAGRQVARRHRGFNLKPSRYRERGWPPEWWHG